MLIQSLSRCCESQSRNLPFTLFHENHLAFLQQPKRSSIESFLCNVHMGCVESLRIIKKRNSCEVINLSRTTK